ncbi:pentapeptide repeat-containing protein [Micromonospora peucetia]|uniref:Pentapeptide repeat-containing protein n=1 Tax=Micromonospora peucetia TaxID=47871 RepID=A0A1C6U9W0_9ACTN|nr:pentapeptide repeat-containing protein [Micromonospora peucetia]WSA33691.1 pentapeptide repeat-containing protein [Micromonospora peucetia]SCL50812.1 Pentapeptide repeat-containing protein [Micromonospora peucetia]
MRTTTVGDVTLLLPDLDQEDLDQVTDVPDDDLRDGLVEDVSWRGQQIADLSIRGCRITGADLGEINWEGGALYGCEIVRTDLSGAALTGVSIERCSVTGSRFTGTRLVDVRLKDALFDNCLRGSRLHAFTGPLDNLRGVALTEDQLPELTRMAVNALSIDVRADAARGHDR